MDSLKFLRDRAIISEGEFRQAFRDRFPVGTFIRWSRGGIRSGGVVERFYEGDVRVHNTLTGSTYWVQMTDVLI